MKKISIIIPCYNAEDCVDTCLESVASQTIGIENMEIILVNDASTDGTFQKLCQWEKRFEESILVINCEKNGKQGQARNIGMQYATGEYIGFADDDDVLEADMCRALYKAARENSCDMAVCRSVTGSEAQIKQALEAEKEKGAEQPGEIWNITTKEDRQKLLERNINIAIWNKIYRREFLTENNICFLPGYIYDDIYFSALVKQYCKKIYFSSAVYYHHRINSQSASYSVGKPSDRFGFIEVHIILIEELRKRGLYQPFAAWYEEQFVIDCLTFLISFEKNFGKLDEKLFAFIAGSVGRLFPDFREIPLVKAITQSGKKPQYQQLLERLLREIV